LAGNILYHCRAGVGQYSAGALTGGILTEAGVPSPVRLALQAVSMDDGLVMPGYRGQTNSQLMEGCMVRRGVFKSGTSMVMAFCGAAAVQGMASQAAAEPAGHITALTGTAHAVADKIERPLAVSNPVNIGDLIHTAAAARLGLLLGKDTRIDLGPLAKLHVENHLVDAGGTFDLVDGSLFFAHIRPVNARPPSAAQKAQIRSPYGLIAVRGTKFFAGHGPKGFSVFVAEGRVDVTAARKTVRLGAGQGTDIAAVGRPPSLPKTWGAPRIRESLMLTTGTPAIPK
jgi:FecR protein